MACNMGKDGVIKVTATGGTATAVGHVRNWSIDESIDLLEGTSMGDIYKDYCPALKDWSGSMDVLWEPTDAGQQILQVGSVVQVILYPTGEAALNYFSGTIIVQSISRTASYDGLVELSMTFQGTGDLVIFVD